LCTWRALMPVLRSCGSVRWAESESRPLGYPQRPGPELRIRCRVGDLEPSRFVGRSAVRRRPSFAR